MREATLTLPIAVDTVTPSIGAELCKAFGGYSRQEVMGEWISDAGEVFTDHNYRYIIGMDDTGANRQKLIDIACHYGSLTDQLAVYLTYPDGECAILDITPEVINVA